MKVGDKVVVRDGAWAWMQSYGWTAATKSFTIDGKSGKLLDVGEYFCCAEFEDLVLPMNIPKQFLSPIGEGTENSKRNSDCNRVGDKAILLRAIEHYGAKNQAAQLTGEMGEMAAELTRHFFQGRDSSKKIAEEAADVQIMLEQIILHLGIEKDVAECRSNKLKRLESRMNQAD